MQYTTYTSQSAKLLANGIYKLIGHDTKFNNPIYIDNFIRHWSGTIGRYLLQLSDDALIENGLPVIVIAPNDKYYEKTISNMQEVIARGGKILFITDKKKESLNG